MRFFKCNHRRQEKQIELVLWTDIDGVCKYCGKYRCKKCGTVFIEKGQTTGKWIKDTFEWK